MSLPSSRNKTYTAATPVASADLNALQDQIIGAKHPSLPCMFPAQKAIVTTAANASLATTGEKWTANASCTLVVGLSDRIPVGTRITNLTWYYDRIGAGNITLKLFKKDLTSAAAAVQIGATITVSAGTGIANSVLAANYVMEAGFELYATMAMDTLGHIYYGAKIDIDRL